MTDADRTNTRFTESEYWDDYWLETDLPRRIDWGRTHSLDAILEAARPHVPTGAGRTALEVGGAPGAYLAFFMDEAGLEGSVLDYSDVGCESTRRNFALLDMPVTVFQGDMFDGDLDIGRFDFVFSIGLIEHFGDLTEVMRRHVALAKPGGIVMVGCPNLRGVNKWFLERVAPELLATHNTDMMDPRLWEAFEEELGLEVLEKRYVGGFEPQVFYKAERTDPTARFWRFVAGVLKLLAKPRPFKHVDAGWFSHFILGVYRVPGPDAS